MKYLKLALLCLLAGITFQPVFSQKASPPVYVLVHGAWGGGWTFKKVDSLLTATGGIVYRPTLTGQGERVHLATAEVGLDTHIQDIVNTIFFEELDNIVLVGHSYGGMVVTGVADRIPDRISKLVYLDAFLPEDGESLRSITGSDNGRFKIVNGYVVPPWVAEGKAPPKDVPHPEKTLTDPISLKNPDRLKIPTTYVLTVDKGLAPEDDGFASQAARAKSKGWAMMQLEADHNAQRSAPEELVKMLREIESN